MYVVGEKVNRLLALPSALRSYNWEHLETRQLDILGYIHIRDK